MYGPKFIVAKRVILYAGGDENLYPLCVGWCGG